MAFVRLTCAEALEASGNREGARKAIAVARDRLLQRADPISDDSIRKCSRKCFLENLSENARTLELAREWLREELPRRGQDR